MASKTANGKYMYNSVHYNKSMDSWVQKAHKSNCIANGWRHSHIKKGAFGYDSIVVSLNHLFEKLKTTTDPEKLAEAVHQGWCENYIYWRDNKPSTPYTQPLRPLNDNRRNRCAELPYDKLNENEKDRVFVNFVLEQLSIQN